MLANTEQTFRRQARQLGRGTDLVRKCLRARSYRRRAQLDRPAEAEFTGFGLIDVVEEEPASEGQHEAIYRAPRVGVTPRSARGGPLWQWQLTSWPLLFLWQTLSRFDGLPCKISTRPVFQMHDFTLLLQTLPALHLTAALASKELMAIIGKHMHGRAH